MSRSAAPSGLNPFTPPRPCDATSVLTLVGATLVLLGWIGVAVLIYARVAP